MRPMSPGFLRWKSKNPSLHRELDWIEPVQQDLADRQNTQVSVQWFGFQSVNQHPLGPAGMWLLVWPIVVLSKVKPS
jgi:hypothetical protein